MINSTASRASWIGGAGLIVLTVIAAVMRLPLLNLGLSRDEAASFFDIQASSLSGVIETVNLSELNPPAFFVVTYYWTQLVGDAEVMFKMPAFLFGVALVPATFWLTLEATGSRLAALIAAALLGLAPEPVFYSQEARPYTMAALTVCLASACFLRALTSDRSRAALAGYIVVGTLAVYVHYTNLALIGGFGLITLLLALTHRPRWRHVRLVVAGAAILLCFAPWVPTFLGQLATGTPWSLPAPLVERPRLIFDNLAYIVPLPLIGAQREGLRKALSGLLLALVVVVLWRRSGDGREMKDRLAQPPLVIALALTIVATILGLMSFNRRYMFPFLPLAAATVAWLVTEAGDRLTKLWRNTPMERVPLLTGAALALALLAIDGVYAIRTAQQEKSGVRALAADLRQLDRDTLVLVVPDVHAATVGYYLRDTGITLHGMPQWSRPEVFNPHTYLELWERPRLVVDIKERIRSAAAQGVEHLAVIQPLGGIVDAGRLPMSRGREVMAFVEQTYPRMRSSEYRGLLESMSLQVFGLAPASQSETASARRF